MKIFTDQKTENKGMLAEKNSGEVSYKYVFISPLRHYDYDLKFYDVTYY
jgi:hypothetical protein